jgi:hypothetical protein
MFHQTFHLQRETTQRHAAPGDSKLLKSRGFAAGREGGYSLAKVDVEGSSGAPNGASSVTANPRVLAGGGDEQTAAQERGVCEE